MDHIIPAEFNGTSLSIIDRDGQKWLTAEEVGRCLGYADANVSAGIRNLYSRHADEFTETDTCCIKLMRQGQTREVRVFSAEGCVMVAMFANTPRAKAFRQWAKQVLANPARAALQDMTLAREIGALRDALAAQQKQIVALGRQVLLAREREVRFLRQRLAEEAQRRIDRVILLEAAGMPRAQIVTETGLSFNYIRQIVFRARRDGHLGIDITPQQGALALGEAA